MKKSKNIIFNLFVIILILIGCDPNPRIKKKNIYPSNILPIYFIDTFQIKTPRVAFVNSIPYVFSLDNIKSFESKEEFIEKRGVIRYLTYEMYNSRRYVNNDIYINSWFDMVLYKSMQSIYRKENRKKDFNINIDENICMNIGYSLIFDSIFNEIPVYRFIFEPEKFILSLINTDSVYNEFQYDYPYVTSKNYTLSLLPIYNKKSIKKSEELFLRNEYLQGVCDDENANKYETLIEKTITVFLNSEISKNHKVFIIGTSNFLNKELGICIMPSYFTYYRDIIKPPWNGTRFLVTHIIKDNKLFYWHTPDSDSLSEETLKAFSDFNIYAPVDNGLLYTFNNTFNENAKVAIYFYDNNLNIKKSLISNTIIDFSYPKHLRREGRKLEREFQKSISTKKSFWKK